jgi:hypothetical protein
MAKSTQRTNFFLIVIAVVAALVVGYLWMHRKHAASEAPASATPTASAPAATPAIAVSTDHVDPANEGHEISMSGVLEVKTPATDSQLGVRADAIMLLRFVEMLQWQETCQGSNCSYQQVWSPQVINSAKFHDKDHKNPNRFPFTTGRFSSTDVRLGAFRIDAATLGNYRLDASLRIKPEPLKVTSAELPSNLAISFRDSNGALYAGDPDHRQIGDIRVSYRTIPATKVDLVGVQRGDRLIIRKSSAPGATPMPMPGQAPPATPGGG